MSATERVINDLNVAKITLCNPQMLLNPEMRVRIGQVINSAIDLLKAQPRWISVKDRLPEPGWYLIATPGPEGEKGFVYKAGFSRDLHTTDHINFYGLHRPGWYVIDGEWGCVECDDVTHWMPLPEPPEENKHAE